MSARLAKSPTHSSVYNPMWWRTCGITLGPQDREIESCSARRDRLVLDVVAIVKCLLTAKDDLVALL